jgi:sulfur carrier protein ThiS
MLIPILFFAARLQSAFGGIPAGLQQPAPASTKVVAKVNGTPISVSDIEPLLWEWRHAEVEQDLINYLMVKAACDKAGVTATDAEVQLQVDQLMNKLSKQVPAGRTVADILAAQGSTPSRVFLKVKTQVLVEKLQLSTFHPEDFIKISTIEFPSNTNKGDGFKIAADKAKAAYALLQKATPWDTVLASTTNDQQVLSRSGSLGWKALGAFPGKVKQQFPTLAVGQVTTPQETALGVQVFRIDMKGKDATGKDLDDLRNFYLGLTRSNVLALIKSEVKVERF